NHGDDAVDRHAAFHRRPLEGLDQRLGQRQARGLDQDVVDFLRSREDGIERGHEIVGHRAANAAIGKLHHVFLGAGLDAATPKDFTVDANVAEFVDDDGKPLAARVLDEVSDQRRLAGAEKPGDNSAGNAFERVHWSSLKKSMVGMRAIRPRLSDSGRARYGMKPSVERAKRSAPATRSSPLSSERPPKT